MPAPSTARDAPTVVRIIHLSDIHHQVDWKRRSWWSTGWRGLIGRFELHGMGRLARFDGVLARIEQLIDDLHALDADHAVITGDVSALGHEDEIGRVHELLAPLLKSNKLTVIPGNHDRYTDRPGARVFERFFERDSVMPEHAVHDGFPFVRFVGDDLAVVGLDSTRVSGWSHYFVGRLGAEQLAALEKILDDPRLAGRTVAVLLHHGPFGPHGRFDWTHSGLIDSKELLRIVTGRNAVLLHGHSHERYWHARHEERPHILSAGSSTERGREGYWIIDMDDHAALEARRYGPGRKPHS